MKEKHISTLLIILLSVIHATSGPSSPFVRYDADNGLSHNTVRCVVQDTRGFMWFGTADGLN